MKKQSILLGILLTLVAPVCAMEKNKFKTLSQKDILKLYKKLKKENKGSFGSKTLRPKDILKLYEKLEKENKGSFGRRTPSELKGAEKEFEESKGRYIFEEDLPCAFEIISKELEKSEDSAGQESKKTNNDDRGFVKQSQGSITAEFLLDLILNRINILKEASKKCDGRVKIAVGKTNLDFDKMKKEIDIVLEKDEDMSGKEFLEKISEKNEKLDIKLSALEQRVEKANQERREKKETKQVPFSGDGPQDSGTKEKNKDSGTLVRRGGPVITSFDNLNLEQENQEEDNQYSTSNDSSVDSDTSDDDSHSDSESDDSQASSQNSKSFAKQFKFSSWLAKRKMFWGGGGIGTILATILCSRKIYRSQKKAHARGKQTSLDHWFDTIQNLIKRNKQAA